MFEKVLAKCRVTDHYDAKRILEVLDVEFPPATGTMKGWCELHDGQNILTIQKDNYSGAFWIPFAREIDAHSRATSVSFDSSVREYRGMKVISASRDLLIVADSWHTIAYVTQTN